MHNIILICTAHKSIGNCNSEELYKIIEKINPEIIFEEIDFSRTEVDYRNQYVHTIETFAIIKYLQNHQFLHIPVETYNIPETYVENIDYINAKISNSNEEYNNLFKTLFKLAERKGFSYLNSMECSYLFEKICTLKEDVVKTVNDEKLTNVYKSWQIVTDNRENEMLKNIYEYSSRYYYNNAIFITGAEHRKSIIDKIQNYEKKYELKLNWEFNIYNK